MCCSQSQKPSLQPEKIGCERRYCTCSGANRKSDMNLTTSSSPANTVYSPPKGFLRKKSS